MTKEYFYIGNTPAILWGDSSDKVYLYIHGKSASAEDAYGFARIICPKGYQVVSIDLPKSLLPWDARPAVRDLAAYAGLKWHEINLFAVSIGAWFSLTTLAGTDLKKALLVSPILDMNRLIGDMMTWANVTSDELKERGEIQTDFGETLSWRYLTFAREHTIDKWTVPTRIIYAGRDNLTPRTVVDDFCRKFGADLTVMKDGEHWFHTPEQLEVLNRWMDESTRE